MNFIARVMRAMAQLHIGAGLGLLAWALWSGWQVVTGPITPGHHAAERRALALPAHAAPWNTPPAGLR